jgi:hypothetical protein
MSDNDNVYELFPRKPLSFRKTTEEKIQAFLGRNNSDPRSFPLVENSEPIREPIQDEIQLSRANTMRYQGYLLGIENCWPEGIPYTPPTEEEVQLSHFEADYYTKSRDQQPPQEWRKVARDKLNELKQQRADEAGFKP